MIVIQSDLGGGLRRPNGGKIVGRARGAGVAFSWVVRGRLAGSGRTPLFLYETFISSSCVYMKTGNSYLETRPPIRVEPPCPPLTTPNRTP
jgi:hypothetical protein